MFCHKLMGAVSRLRGSQKQETVARWSRAGHQVGVSGPQSGLKHDPVSFAAAQPLLALAFRNARFLPISAAPSLPILGFAFALSLITGVIFGVAPAWFATRTDPAEALRGTGR